ncbi:MAG: ATP-dependent RecD-like DNA helicase [Opitutales bacterium]
MGTAGTTQAAQGAQTRLRGVLERIRFFNEENQFCIGELRPEQGGQTVTVSGRMPSVQCGETLDLDGEWTTHAQYGDRFQVKAFSSALPASVYGIRKYLGSGLVKGIGKAYADKIVDHFGDQTLEVITHQSGRLREVEGIGPTRAKQIKAAWDAQRAVREVMLFLQTYGVSPARCVKLVQQYGAGARRILETEPYRVASDIDGIGFKTADAIALNLGLSSEGAARIDAGILHALEKLEGEGHTAYPNADLVDEAARLLNVTASKVDQRLEALLADGQLGQPGEGPLVQAPACHRAENSVAESVYRLLKTPSGLPSILVDKAVEWAQDKAGFAFAQGQKEAVRTALVSKFSILTGGPGTGKTTILQALVAILRAKRVRVVLAAPTGRAAQRLSESAGIPARTIHRLLSYENPDGDGRREHNADRPLQADFLIVDEASMLDTRLAARLLRAVANPCSVLLVGDTDQLPSVGSGNVLADLIRSEQVPTVRLDTIFRQKGRSAIVSTAHAILKGEVSPAAICDHFEEVETGADLHFIRAESPGKCLERTIELCRDWLPRWYRLDPIGDVQVLAPMHRGEAGIGNLNQALQEGLNPSGRSIRVGQASYQVGDKVMQFRNNYDKNIFNGDLGIVTAVSPEAGTLAARFDDVVHDFDRGELNDLNTAYAVSVHKSQGSEFPVVVMPLVRQHYIMLQRNLLYTGITRARRKVFLVGDPSAYAMAVRNRETAQRQTDLRRKLQSMFAP